MESKEYIQHHENVSIRRDIYSNVATKNVNYYFPYILINNLKSVALNPNVSHNFTFKSVQIMNEEPKVREMMRILMRSCVKYKFKKTRVMLGRHLCTYSCIINIFYAFFFNYTLSSRFIG